MAYCTSADIQAMIKDPTFTSATKVTLSEISDIIDQMDDLINARLNTIYVTAITGAKSLKIMKLVSQLLTSAEVWRRLKPANLPQGETSLSAQWDSRAEKILSAIVKGDMQLEDAEQISIVERSNEALMDSGVNNLVEGDAGFDSQFTIGDQF